MVEIKTLDFYDSLQEYIKLVRKYINIEKIYLFGSYATGKNNNESDIDLAIISSSLSGDSFNDNVFLGKLTWGINTRIEPIGFTPQSFSDSILAIDILKSGIELDLAEN
ncbi:MAG: nucleotidyltransferase [Ignavibacteriae bacterium]|jgi:predicted nucleotidyltransferase|nr:nucleotidyltransferase [Ignavibacteriota bacterium]